MTTKAAFNADEWERITSAPVLAAMLVLAADRGGTMRESLSLARAYQEAREQHPSELLADVLASPPTIDPASAPGTTEDLRREAAQRLREALELLEQRAEGEEVVEYRNFVHVLAETVARAHKEGGVLGIGGKEISEEEQAALDEIDAMLGLKR